MVHYKKKFTLNQINYKCWDNHGALIAIQLCFTNGFKIPLFEHMLFKDSTVKMNTIQVDSTKQIRKICVKTHSRNLVCGLKLIGEDESCIIDVNWATALSSGEWSTHSIPQGEEIIGIECDKFMRRIGFICHMPTD